MKKKKASIFETSEIRKLVIEALPEIEQKILNFLEKNKGKKFYSDEIADKLNINSAWTVFKSCENLSERGLIK